MSEVARIADQLRRAHEGEAWHGPSLKEILADVDAELAHARAVPGGHTIAELVLHIANWEDVVRRRLQGEVIASVPDDEDWPAAGDGPKAWGEARRRLEEGHQRLRVAVAAFDKGRLDEKVPGKGCTFYGMLHGIVQHDLYHAGQIAILKKARPSGTR